MTAALAGATGLVGGAALGRLLADPAFARVVVLARRTRAGAEPHAQPGPHPKLEWRVVDFERLDRDADALGVDAVLCALGTTMRRAGSQAAFRRVDHDYAVALARLGRAQGARHFGLVSALGADAGSRVFYTRVKGEVEAAVGALGYPSVTIVRPALLLGARAEFRLGERVAQRFAALVPGKYRPVAAGAVAAVLVRAVREDRPGTRVIESAEIRALAAGASR